MKEHVWIESSRGKKLSAMIHQVEGGQGKPVVVFSHGFTGDKLASNQLLRHIAEAVEQAGCNAVRFDFAGSGDSEGQFATDTTVTGWREDLCSVLAWVKKQPMFQASSIYLLGHSLGGCIVLLHEDGDIPIAGRIAIAPVVHPVTNFRDIIIGPELWQQAEEGKAISNFYGKGFTLNSDFVTDLLAKAYQPIATAKTFNTPLCIIHGTADAAVPIAGSKELYHGYRGPKAFHVFEGVDHVFTGHMPELCACIAAWLKQQ